MPIISKVGVASILDQMLPFSVQILGTTLRDSALTPATSHKPHRHAQIAY